MNRILILLITIILFITAGCGGNFFEGLENKNSSEAKEIDISKKLDSGDYDAILNNPNASALDYAAAAMGAAGLNPADLLDALNNMAEQSSTNDLSSVVSISINPEFLDELQSAKEKLEDEMDCENNPDGAKCLDPNLNFQLVMTSLTSTVTAIAQVGGDASVDTSDGISETEAVNISNYLVANPGAQVDTDGDNAPDTSLALVIANDMVDVGGSLPNADLGTDSDLNEVLTETTQGEGSINYDGQGDVTETDVSNYLQCVLGTGGPGC